jgi:hypothetical protein
MVRRTDSGPKYERNLEVADDKNYSLCCSFGLYNNFLGRPLRRSLDGAVWVSFSWDYCIHSLSPHINITLIITAYLIPTGRDRISSLSMHAHPLKILTLLSSRGLNRYLTSFQSVDNLVGFFFGNEILLPTLALIEFDAVTYTTFCRFPFPFPFHPPNHMPCISLTIYRVAYICLYLSRVLRQQP